VYRNKTKKSLKFKEFEYFTTNDYPIKLLRKSSNINKRKVYICQLDFDCITEKENDFIGEPSNNIYSYCTK